MQRKLALESLAGITLSMHAESTEFVLHVRGGVDFRIKAEK